MKNNNPLHKLSESFKRIHNTIKHRLGDNGCDEINPSPSKSVQNNELVSGDRIKTELLPSKNTFYKLENKIRNYWESHHQRIIRNVGLISGTIFIVLGICVLSASAEKVVDNVVFGERSVIAAFLIILGVLLITGALAPDITRITSFDNLFQEVKKVEKKPNSKVGKDQEKPKPKK